MTESTDNGTDTKVCPFCAETIKAAAIKCRYCGSELPASEVLPPEPEVEPEVEVAPEPAAEPAPEPAPEPEPQPEPAGSLPRWILAGMVASALALVVLGILAFTAWRGTSDLRDSEDSAKAVRATVAADVEALLSYDYKTYDDDVAKAEKLLTPAFRKEYAPTVQSIRDAALEQKRTQQAVVVAVSVVDSSPDEVKTLLFVNTTTFTVEDKRQRLLQNRIGVTLTRSDGQWRISDVTFPQT